MFGHVKNEVPIIDRLVSFFKLWRNEEESDTDGSTPLKPHNLYIFEVSYDFVFKWFVSEEEMRDAAKHVGIELTEGQSRITLELGEYLIELEKYADDDLISDRAKQIEDAIDNALKP
jgi:hypothetical protein